MINPLVLLTFFPLLGCLVIALLNSEQKAAIRWVALATSLVTFGISLWLLALFNPADPNLQWVYNAPWALAWAS
jgi:NADH-quinone oxidoreductase subunit M